MCDWMTREEVIKGLKICTKNESFAECVSKECPFIGGSIDGNCIEMLMHNALALLKAQEPRVMKICDVRKWVNSDRVTREPVVIEIRGGVCAWIIDDEVREIPGDANLSSDLYGKTWRCWTSRPTEAQREVTPWE